MKDLFLFQILGSRFCHKLVQTIKMINYDEFQNNVSHRNTERQIFQETN